MSQTIVRMVPFILGKQEPLQSVEQRRDEMLTCFNHMDRLLCESQLSAEGR